MSWFELIVGIGTFLAVTSLLLANSSLAETYNHETDKHEPYNGNVIACLVGLASAAIVVLLLKGIGIVLGL